MASDNLVVGSVVGNAIPVPASPSLHATVANAGPSAVYYKKEATVSSSSKEGELAKGESVTFGEGIHWFLAAEKKGARLFVTNVPEATTDMATQAELDTVHGLSPVLNVKDSVFGAKGDGATDDSTAIQAALNVAAAAGGIVFVPSGTYLIGTTLILNPDVTVMGSGPGASILKLKNGANTTVIKTANYGTTGSNDFAILELAIDGNNANNAAGHCLLIDGLRFELCSLHLHHAPEDNLNAQSTNVIADEDAAGGYESSVSHLKLYLAGRYNLNWNAQDGFLFDVMAICKDATSTKTNVLIGENAGICKMVNVHPWGQCKYAFDLKGSSMMVDCEAEGGVSANVLLEAEGISYLGGKVFADGSGHGKVGFLWPAGAGHNTTILGTRIKECVEGALVFTGNGEGSRVSALVELEAGKTAVLGAPDLNTVVLDISVRGGGTVGCAQPIRRFTPNSGDEILSGAKAGDTHNRYELSANGFMGWSSGALAPDVFLERSGAKVLKLTGRLQQTEGVEIPEALAERAEAAEFEASATRPTLVTGYVEVASATRTQLTISVAEVVVSQIGDSVTTAGTQKLPFTFLVPAGKKWKWNKVEGTVAVFKTSYTKL
jgi:hypothetical protein